MNFNFFEAIALIINGPLVRWLVSFVLQIGPDWPNWIKKLLVVVAGPGLLMLANFLTDLLGFPIDLSRLAMVLGGLATSAFAMITFDLKKLKDK